MLVPQTKPADPYPPLHAGRKRDADLEDTNVSRHERQGFLGKTSESVLERVRPGIVGLGGGGSHIAQQLAHIGVGRFVLSDMDHYEDKNHNRTVGGVASDIDKRTPRFELRSERYSQSTRKQMFSPSRVAGKPLCPDCENATLYSDALTAIRNATSWKIFADGI